MVHRDGNSKEVGDRQGEEAGREITLCTESATGRRRVSVFKKRVIPPLCFEVELAVVQILAMECTICIRRALLV